MPERFRYTDTQIFDLLKLNEETFGTSFTLTLNEEGAITFTNREGEVFYQMKNQSFESALSIAGLLRLNAIPAQSPVWAKLADRDLIVVSNETPEAQKLLTCVQKLRLPFQEFEGPHPALIGAKFRLTTSEHTVEQMLSAALSLASKK